MSATARLCGQDGTVVDLDVGAWAGEATDLERRLLAGLRGPVLDIGCGPGRLVLALAELGMPAMGVDASAAAVQLATARNATALVRSVFDPVPGTGRWGSALLFDGNIGIGGDPARLVARAGELLRPGGRLLVETAPPPAPLHRFAGRVERGPSSSAWFGWATIGAQALTDLATDAGFAHVRTTVEATRWFVELERRP